MVRHFALAAVVIAFTSLTALATDPWIGKTVFGKNGATAMVGDDEIDIQTVRFPATVGDVKGDWLWLGRAWVHKDDVILPEHALDYYSDQIRKKSSTAEDWSNRGAVWNGRGEFDNAIKDFTQAIYLDPTFASAYTKRGDSWSKKGEFEKAIQDYTDSMRLDPSDPDSFNAAAWLRATCPDGRHRDGTKAVANATTACILTDWKDSSFIDTLAAAYAQSGDFKTATKWQEKAIDLAENESDKPAMLIRLGLYQDDKPFRDTLDK